MPFNGVVFVHCLMPWADDLHYTTGPYFLLGLTVSEAYFSLVVVAFLLLGSPGPGPLAIAATGAVFGVRQGVRFLLGLVLGFAVVLCLQGLGLATLLSNYPEWARGLQLFGLLYIMYMAYKIATAPIADESDQPTSPPGLLDGVVLNASNPKAHAAVLAIHSQFLLPHESTSWAYFMTGLVCFVVVLVVDLLLGKVIRPVMHQPSTGRLVRWLFALLMLAAVVWVVLKNN